MLEGNSFCLDDLLGRGDSYGDGKSQFISTHMPQEGPSVLSLYFLEEKQHLGGEDCNIPKFSFNKLEY